MSLQTGDRQVSFATPRDIQHLGIDTIATGEDYSVPIEKGTIVQVSTTDAALMSILPEWAFGGHFGSHPGEVWEGGVGDFEENTLTQRSNIFDAPLHIWATQQTGASLTGRPYQQEANDNSQLLNAAAGGLWELDEMNGVGEGAILLDKAQTDQEYVFEYQLGNQADIAKLPLNRWFSTRGSAQHTVRGGITGVRFRVRHIHSSAAQGLDWTVMFSEEDDGARTYWDDGAGALTATLSDAWTALSDEITLTTQTLTFNTATNDAYATLMLRPSSGGGTTDFARLYSISVHPPIVASQGTRLPQLAGESGPHTFVMPYRGVLGFVSDTDAATAYISEMF